MALPLSLSIAVTHLRSRTRQTLVSMLGVAMGVGFFVAMASMMQGFQKDFVRRIVDSSPHIVMKDEYRNARRQPAPVAVPKGAVEVQGVRPRDEIRGIKRAAAITRELGKRPDITVAPSLHGQAILRYGSKDVAVSVIGIVPDLERRVTDIEEDLVEGSLAALVTSSNGIILGSGIVRKLGIGMGDTVSAVSPTGVILRMKVVGITRTGIVAIDDQESYVLLKKSQILQKRQNVTNRIRLRVRPVEEARAIAASIEAQYGYRTESWQESNEGVMGIFVIQNGIMYSTVGAILIVACFGIFNIISTVIFEKTRDIAILKSIGFAEGDIKAIFVTEGLLVGIAGSVLGWGLGFTLTSLLASLRFEVSTIVEMQRFILHYSIWHYVIASAMSILAAVLAAWIPSRRAARLRPVDIIRGAA